MIHNYLILIEVISASSAWQAIPTSPVLVTEVGEKQIQGQPELHRVTMLQTNQKLYLKKKLTNNKIETKTMPVNSKILIIRNY